MMLWPLLLASALAVAGAETPNQSLSITSVVSPEAEANEEAAESDPPPESFDSKEPVAIESEAPPLSRRSGPALLSRKVDSENAASPLSRQQTTWWVTTAFGLLIVLTVLLAASKALRKIVPGLGGAATGGPLHLLYRTFLGPKQSVCLFRCGNRLLLIGVTAETMQTLAEITDAEEIDFIKGQCMEVSPRSASAAFKDAVKQTQRRPVEEPPPQTSTTPEELTQQLGRLRERILSFNKAQ